MICLSVSNTGTLLKPKTDQITLKMGDLSFGLKHRHGRSPRKHQSINPQQPLPKDTVYAKNFFFCLFNRAGRCSSAASVERVLSKIKGTTVPIVQSLLPLPAQKEVVRGSPKSFRFGAIFQTAGFVGIDLLASPFLLQSDDEEKTNNEPGVSCLWVSNHGSASFTVEFDVYSPSDAEKPIRAFDLYQEGEFIERESSRSNDPLDSNYCDWLSIPGFDGSTSTAPIGSHSFDFTIVGLRLVTELQLIGALIYEVYIDDVEVDISLYVTVNS